MNQKQFVATGIALGLALATVGSLSGDAEGLVMLSGLFIWVFNIWAIVLLVKKERLYCIDCDDDIDIDLSQYGTHTKIRKR